MISKLIMRRVCDRCILFFGAAALTACAPSGTQAEQRIMSPLVEACPALAETPEPAFWLCAIGNRDAMLDSGGLEAQISSSDYPSFKRTCGSRPRSGITG